MPLFSSYNIPRVVPVCFTCFRLLTEYQRKLKSLIILYLSGDFSCNLPCTCTWKLLKFNSFHVGKNSQFLLFSFFNRKALNSPLQCPSLKSMAFAMSTIITFKLTSQILQTKQ